MDEKSFKTLGSVKCSKNIQHYVNLHIFSEPRRVVIKLFTIIHDEGVITIKLHHVHIHTYLQTHTHTHERDR
jgi:hypothetical protein